MKLFKISIGINTDALMRWGGERRVGNNPGYIVHAATRKVFGVTAPQPFYLDRRTGTLCGYTAADENELQHSFEDFTLACPDDLELVQAIFDMSSIRTSLLPEKWNVGERWDFSLLCRPIVRNGRKESDVWLRRNFLEWQEAVAAGTFFGGVREFRMLHRDEALRVYCEWLAEKMLSAAYLEKTVLNFAHSTTITGRGGTDHSGAPVKTSRKSSPAAHFSGTLTVRDDAAFDRLIRHGVGRHCAFGYGMLRLRKAD